MSHQLRGDTDMILISMLKFYRIKWLERHLFIASDSYS